MGPELPPEAPPPSAPREPLMGPNRSAFLAGMALAWLACIVFLGQPGLWVVYASAFAVAILLAFAILVRARQRTGTV